MGLDLNSGDIIFLDTAPFIYFFERHPDYFPALETLFDRLYEVDAQAITSIITYIELACHRITEKVPSIQSGKPICSAGYNYNIFSIFYL